MLRSLAPSTCLLFACLVACRDAPLPPAGPPNLVGTRASRPIGEGLMFAEGEQMAWRVTWRGLEVGRAELSVAATRQGLQAESRFRTIGIAEELHPTRHHLVSRLGDDDLHTALGRIRHWVGPDSRPATLAVRFQGETYQLELAQPIRDLSLPSPSLRVRARARGPRGVIQITLWLSTDRRRAPLQFLVSAGKDIIRATLVSS